MIKKSITELKDAKIWPKKSQKTAEVKIIGSLCFMLVEDNTTIRRVLRKICQKTFKELQKEKEFKCYELRTFIEASNGESALKKLKISKDEGEIPDIILCDWRMPLMNGLQFIKEIKTIPAFSKIPIILSTVEDEEEKVTTAIKAGVRHYLAKPFPPHVLKEKLKKIIKTELFFPILIVEDERELRRILKKNIEKLFEEIKKDLAPYINVKILEAEDGKMGLERLRMAQEEEHLPKLIISDWRMPGMDGLSFAIEVKKNPILAKIPILMSTVESEKKKVMEAIKAGIQDYVTKPFTNELLREKIKHIILDNIING
ncbi:response regulator [Candidatus Riflebacteria bacterium]